MNVSHSLGALSESWARAPKHHTTAAQSPAQVPGRCCKLVILAGNYFSKLLCPGGHYTGKHFLKFTHVAITVSSGRFSVYGRGKLLTGSA